MGAVVPLVFRRLGIDPVVASGPLTMTLNDGFVLGSSCRVGEMGAYSPACLPTSSSIAAQL